MARLRTSCADPCTLSLANVICQNDRYSAYRKSMPVNSESYRSFSDAYAQNSSSAQLTNGGQLSVSSSSYSLDAVSPNESPSSSSSSEAGAFYTPSLSANLAPAVQQPHQQHASSTPSVLSAGFPFQSQSQQQKQKQSHQFPSTQEKPPQQHESRQFRKTYAAPTSEAMQTSGSSDAGDRSSVVQAREKQHRELPSYMRGTSASSSKRNSTASVEDANKRHRPESLALISPTTSSNGRDSLSRGASHSRGSSPPQHGQVHSSVKTIPTSAARSHRQSSGHSRQSSLVSATSRKHVPSNINTVRSAITEDGLPRQSAETRQGESRRVSKASNSPSAIAHNILRQTRGSEYESFDISAYAAGDEATAEALRKLDGISSTTVSPRISRAYSASSAKSSATGHTSVYGAAAAADVHATPRKTTGIPGSTSAALSRQNSKASTRTMSPAASSSRPGSARKSWGKATVSASSAHRETSSMVAPRMPPRRKSDENTMTQQAASLPVAQAQALYPPMKSPLRSSPSSGQSSAPSSIALGPGLRKLSLSSSISAPSLAAAAAAQYQMDGARSPTQASLSPNVTFAHPAAQGSGILRRASGARPPSSGAVVPPTPSLSSKRSSSASLAFATSASDSRDSTSATSISAYGSPAHGRISKGRRGSTSSDVSSVYSGVDGPNRSDRSGGGESGDGEQASSTRAIPPVPPLPKDWESYRPSTSGEGSLPSSASAPSFKEKEKDYLKSPAMPGHRESSGSGSRRVSMEKPAGPRPLRNFSGASSLSPAPSPGLSVSPTLPSPATTTTSLLGPERQQDVSRTPTKQKWSLSVALGINKSPPLPSSQSQPSSLQSYDDSESERMGEAQLGEWQSSENRLSPAPSGKLSEMPRRKLVSVPDIKALGNPEAAKRSPKLPSRLPQSQSAHHLGGETATSRARTESLNNASTTYIPPLVATDNPSLVAISPGRSRSSLLSPRRTPSGIPFFHRRASGQSGTANNPSLTSSPKSTNSKELGASTPVLQEDRPGRKSILGINLFSRSSARKSISGLKDLGAIPTSPKLPQEYQHSMGSATMRQDASTSKNEGKANEFGVRTSGDSKRSSVSARASSIIGRRRGKVGNRPSF